MANLGVVLAPLSWRLRGVLLLTVGALGGAVLDRDSPPPTAPPPVPDRIVERVEVPQQLLETVAVLPEAIHGVTASPYDTRRIAAWNDRSVFASADEGRTFERVLWSDGTVGDVAFDREGQLLAFRGDRWIGIRDTDDEDPGEEWGPLGPFRAREADDDTLYGPRPRLVVYDGGVAIIGPDTTEPTRLLIAWRAASGRWREEILFHDRSERWDTAEVLHIEVGMPGEVQVVVQTWQDGDCGGWDRNHRVAFDTHKRTTRSQLLEGYPDSPPQPDEDVIERAVLDSDGRWIGLDPADARRLVRTRL